MNISSLTPLSPITTDLRGATVFEPFNGDDTIVAGPGGMKAAMAPQYDLASPTAEKGGFLGTPTGRPNFTRSRSSSISQTSSTSRHFSHYREPTVLEKPDAVDEIRNALAREDVRALAELAQAHGLPPSLRPAAWPLLLKQHPLVRRAEAKYAHNPAVAPLADADLPLKRIRGDIGRLRRLGVSRDDEHEIYAAVVDFLRQFGSVIPYEAPMVWVAEFLLNGEHPRGGSAMASSSSLDSPRLGSPRLGPMASPVDAGLSGPVPGSPAPSAGPFTGSPVSRFSRGVSTSSVSSDDSENSILSFAGMTPDSFRHTFQQIMLLMHESPQQYSEFVTLMRTFLPQVGKHFAREGVLGASGGDDWLAWWLRWLGIRAFPPDALARLWDTYFAMHDASPSSVMNQHLFNCIVLMRGNRASLVELDQSECRQFLLHLPPCKDVEAVLVEGKQLAKANS